MSLIGGHLGARASALLDGALTPEETERAWMHVHGCPVCRESVEREAWLKRRLACLSVDPGVAAPETLKGSLLGGPPPAATASAEPVDATGATGATGPVGAVGMVFAFDEHRGRRTLALAAFGGGVLGTAVMGLLAFGAGPADAPTFQRHTPVTAVNTPAVSVMHHARSQR